MASLPSTIIPPLSGVLFSDLTEKFGVPVVFENDINAAVIGFASNIAPPYPAVPSVCISRENMRLVREYG